MGGLLKQLAQSLGRYILFHAGRLVGRTPQRAPTLDHESTVVPKVITAASIGALEDQIDLDQSYEQLVSWPTYRELEPEGAVLADSLYQLWATTAHGHKWSQYFYVYQLVFAPMRAARLRILEIGVWQGSSLKLWKRYFTHPETLIVGIDIRPDCAQFDAPAEGIRVRIGSQADAGFLRRVVAEFGPFDLIIDDGSHQSSHMIASFNHLFAEGLNDSGVYFVEDLHANYWHPWRDSRSSFLDMCKQLLEHMHGHYQRAHPAAFLTERATDQPAYISVPKITTMIREMRFFDSIVAIYKSRIPHVPYYLRGDG